VTIEQHNAERNIAVCYLFSEGDHANRCVLTSSTLIITYRNRDHIFPRETLTGIEIERKKLLLPLLSGGIIVPLSFLGLMNFLIAPALSIFGILAGILLFYTGWYGNEVLIVNATNQYVQFPFRYGTGGVREFVSYTKKVIWKGSNPELCFYIVLSKQEQGKESLAENIKKAGTDEGGYDYNRLIQLFEAQFFKGDELLVSFDPVSSGISVKYEYQSNKSNISITWPGNLNANDFQIVGSIADFYGKVIGNLNKEG
jgi:hypothetical protein